MKQYRPFLQWQHTLAAQSNGAIVSSVCENAYMQEECLKWSDSNYSECFQPLNKSCRINIRQDFTRLPANDVAFCISITYPTAKFVTWIFFWLLGQGRERLQKKRPDSFRQLLQRKVLPRPTELFPISLILPSFWPPRFPWYEHC